MSTFVFAPSWVTYPNNPTTSTNNNTTTTNTNTTTTNKAPKEEIDEFPTLLSHTFKKKTNHNNSVWSNSRLVQKIYNEEEEEDLDNEEKRYELERLKALVPKTRKSLSTTSLPSSLNIKRKQTRPPIILPIKHTKQPQPQPQEKILPKKRKDCISEKEQLQFLYFIKSWTSTTLTTEYTIDSSDSSDSGFQSDTSNTIHDCHSFFQHDPFPLNH